MQDTIKIRALRADEIEVRVAQVGEKGVQLLLYKDSRCDKRILDEIFGVNGWANCYSEIKGNLYCSIMIYDNETGMWIQKQDCGVESNTEKEKGEASDAFKRAAFNIGIGRELYTKIFIYVPTATKQTGTNSKGKPIYGLVDPFQKWHVAKIRTNEETEKIEYLQIADSKTNKIVFTWGKPQAEKPIVEKTKTKVEPIKEEQIKLISDAQRKRLYAIANGNNEVAKRVLARYGYDSSEKIRVQDYEQICTEIESEILM